MSVGRGQKSPFPLLKKGQMIYLIEQKRLTGSKKFNIINRDVKYISPGVSIPVSGFQVELKNFKAEITEEQDEKIKKEHGISIIEKLKLSNDYKSGYLKITEISKSQKPETAAEKRERKAAEKKEAKKAKKAKEVKETKKSE